MISLILAISDCVVTRYYTCESFNCGFIATVAYGCVLKENIPTSLEYCPWKGIVIPYIKKV